MVSLRPSSSLSLFLSLLLLFLLFPLPPCIPYRVFLRLATSPSFFLVAPVLDSPIDFSMSLPGNISYFDAERCKKESHCEDALGGLHYKRAGQIYPAKIVWALTGESLL